MQVRVPELWLVAVAVAVALELVQASSCCCSRPMSMLVPMRVRVPATSSSCSWLQDHAGLFATATTTGAARNNADDGDDDDDGNPHDQREANEEADSASHPWCGALNLSNVETIRPKSGPKPGEMFARSRG